MDYSKLSDFEINCRVAIALGMKEHFFMNAEAGDRFDDEIPLTDRGPIWQTSKNYVGTYRPLNGECFNPCNNPADAWPIIVQNRIGLNFVNGNWRAQSLKTGWVEFCHEKPLRAAMTVFLMMQESQDA